METIFQGPEFDVVVGLLEQNDLPTQDLVTVDLNHFFGCGAPNNPLGVIGLERHGSDGLLRSLAVDTAHQGRGCGAALLLRLEQHAISIGINQLYLLTETAEAFFRQRGFSTIPRDQASDAIRQTSEFSSLCPDAAVLMVKPL